MNIEYLYKYYQFIMDKFSKVKVKSDNLGHDIRRQHDYVMKLINTC